MVGLLATHALAGQRVVGGFEGVVRGLRRLRGQLLNATTTEDYTRCVFQKVPRATCAHEGQRKTKFFKDGPTASRAEAFALCDADPECDAVQEYGDKALINDNRTAWAEPCGADTCYMKCHDLGKDECGRTMLEEDSKNGKEGRRLFDVDDEILLDDADVEDAMWERRLYGGDYDDDPYESPAQHVYTCRPYGEEPGIRSPLAFSLCLIAAILGGPLVVFVGVKLSRRYNCKKDPLEVFVGPTQRKKDKKCGPLEWSLFYWFFSAFWLIIGFGLLAGYFGPQDCDGDVLLYLGISFTSFAGFLLVVSLCLGQFWWRFHREQDMKVSAAAIAPAARAVGALMKVSSDAVAETEVPMATVVGESEPAREPPPLHEIVDALKRNLGLDGNFEEIVNAACLQLGVPPTGSLPEKADACWRAMEG